MDITTVLLLVTLILNTSLSALILASNRRRAPNLLAAVFVGAVSIWIFAILMLRLTLQLFYGQLAFGAAAAIPALLIAFAVAFPKPVQKSAKLLPLALLAAFFVYISFGSRLIFYGPLRLVNNSIIPAHIGPLYLAFIIYFVAFFAIAIGITLRTYRRSTGLERTQIKYVFAGILAAAALAGISSLILPLFKVYSLNSVSPMFALLLTFAMTYTIVKHRFLDIRLIVARSLAYAMLLGTMAIAYAAAIFGTSQLLFRQAHVSTAQDITSTVLALVLAFTFQPLRRFFERVTEGLFYRDHYDSQDVINEFSKILVSELDLNHILKKSLAELCNNLHIQFGQLVVFNDDRVYRIEHYGPLPKRLMIAPELADLNHATLVADELDGGDRKDLMDRHGIRVSLALRTRDEFVGYLLLGDKLSGDIYSDQDLRLLEIIAKELAVAVQNAKAYAQIQEFNVTLQARIDHATGRLRVANRHLKELDRAKDEFISMASHQLRTPLTTIKGYLSMMLEGDAGRLTRQQKEFVGYAFGASERMVNLISDLLNVSRLSAGRFLIQTKPTDMVQMIADEVRQLDTHASAKGIKLIFEAPPHPLPPAQIDDNKTRQVIMNFIDNAIYYTQHGEVRVVLDQTPDTVRLEVHDSGIGVPEAAKKKLFSKFYRADNAQVIRPDGTGLGLYLAKRVVEDQGGTIIFSSIEGKGSTFGFELPTKPLPEAKEDKHAHE